MRVLVAIAVFVVTGCSLAVDLSDLGPSDVAVDAGGDATDERAVEAPCPAGACAAIALPPAWSPVAAHIGFPGCPAGAVSRRYVTDPVASATTCSCGCTLTATPKCDEGMSNIKSSDGPGCGTSGLGLSFKSGACTPWGSKIESYQSESSIWPSGGACATTLVPGAAQSTGVDACLTACPDRICAGDVPSGYKACVVAIGDVACPAGPFTNKRLIGDSVDVACTGTCGCLPTCLSPTMEFFQTSTCTGSIAKLAADGTCAATGAGGQTYNGTRYTATPGCTSTGTAKAIVALVGVRTLCCAP